MTPYLYGLALAVSLLGLGTLDWRHRVALFAQTRRSLAVIAAGVAIFLAWDFAGVGLGIFFIGSAPYLSGWTVAPEIPVEELLFLTLLTYQTLLVWRWLDRRAGRAE